MPTNALLRASRSVVTLPVTPLLAPLAPSPSPAPRVPREPRAERLDVAYPTREALDSTRPDAEEVARIHGPQLARAAREQRSRWPGHRCLRVLATELDPPWHPRNALEGRSLYPPELLARASHLVGASRFERPTTCAQGRCATRLRYAPSKVTQPRNTDSRPHATLQAQHEASRAPSARTARPRWPPRSLSARRAAGTAP